MLIKNKLIFKVCAVLLLFSLISCVNIPTIDEETIPTNIEESVPTDNELIDDNASIKDLNLSSELVDLFKSAYASSIADFVEEVDLNEIEILDYFGLIRDAHIVSMGSNYSGKYPNGVYIEEVKKMEFKYDSGYKIYVIAKDKLYTPKKAYEEKIIDFSELCKLFGIHTSKLETFDEQSYDSVENCLKLKYEEEFDLYEIAKYYGEYNGYSAVSLNYLGMQLAVTSADYVYNLKFEYGYSSNHIRFMNDSEMYSISEALSKNIITKDDLYNIFEIHSKSEKVDEQLIIELLTPAYELCLKYADDFNKEINLNHFSLSKYYGKYGENEIYSLDSTCWIDKVNTSATIEEVEVMEYGFSKTAYVLSDGKLFTLQQALNSGIITEEINKEIMSKYYS